MARKIKHQLNDLNVIFEAAPIRNRRVRIRIEHPKLSVSAILSAAHALAVTRMLGDAVIAAEQSPAPPKKGAKS